MRTPSWRWGCSMLMLVLVVACGGFKPEPNQQPSGQSFARAMALVCHVDDHIGDAHADDPLERDQERSDFLQSRIKNPDVIYHRTLWRVQDTKQRAKMIRDLSRQAELGACPYADSLEQDAF